MKNTQGQNPTLMMILKVVVAVATALLGIVGGAEAYAYLAQ